MTVRERSILSSALVTDAPCDALHEPVADPPKKKYKEMLKERCEVRAEAGVNRTRAKSVLSIV